MTDTVSTFLTKSKNSTIPRTAVILAGGRGTRLGDEAKNLPKPMINIAGKPLLERQVDWLKEFGIEKVILLVGHKAEVIRNYFADGNKWQLQIEIIEEKEALGTAGALLQLKTQLHEDFWVIYGDLVANMSLDKTAEFHANKNADVTLVVHPNDHPYDSDLVDVDGNDQVIKFITKPHPPGLQVRNLVNAAVYILSPKVFKYIPADSKGDLARDIFPKMILHEKVFAFNTPEYLKDMGTPDRLDKVRKDWISGKVASLRSNNPRPTVFLDRDGVVINYVPNLNRAEDVALRPGAGAAIRALNQAGFLVLVATNQPGIAKGAMTVPELSHIHAKMETLLGREAAWIERIFYCPHHPDRDFPGEISELKIKCDCRKPGTGLLEQAAKIFSIDKHKSWMIGDTWRDVECAKTFGVRALGLTGGAGFPYDRELKSIETPEKIFSNILEAAEFIISSYETAKKEASV